MLQYSYNRARLPFKNYMEIQFNLKLIFKYLEKESSDEL